MESLGTRHSDRTINSDSASIPLEFKLADLIDIPLFQTLQDKLNEIYSFPSAIIDTDGNILTATAWQDICTKFHRIHPESEEECKISDNYISNHLAEAKPAVTYRCPHGLVDNATPIIIDGQHLGNFFTGQFFLEKPDILFFKSQAQKYGFDEESYLDAVSRVPVWSEKQLAKYLSVIKTFTEILAGIGLKNLEEQRARKTILQTRETLIDSEEKFRTLFENSPVGISITNIDGSLTTNQAFSDIVGFSVEELNIKTWAEITHPDDRAISEQGVKILTGGHQNKLRFEKRYIHKNGQVIWVDLSMYLQKDLHGNPKYYISVINDITQRKKAEEEVQHNAERLALILEQTSGGVWDWNIQTGKAVFSPRYARMLGYEPEEFARSYEQWGVIVHPDDIERVKKEHEDHFAGIKEFSIEFRMKEKSGGWHWIHSRGILIERDSQARPLRMVGTHTDIQKRKLADAALTESEMQLRGIFDNLQDAFFQADLSGRFTLISRSALPMYGYGTPEELIGQPASLLYANHHDRETMLDGLRKSGHLEDFVCLARRKDGSSFWVSMNVQLRHDADGKVIGTEGVVRDITDRKRTELALIEAKQKAEENDRLKSAFLANMSHELRTPLNSIIGFAELITDPDYGQDEHKEFARLIHDSGNTLLTVLSDIMDISKIESGQLTVTKDRISVNELIFSLQVKFSYQAIKKGIIVRLDESNPGEEIIIQSDRQRIGQIMNNLIGNAIKFTEKGFVEIGFHPIPGYLQFHVRDTGIGIPKEFQEQIFDRFRQVESSLNRKHGGNGLGLSISKSLVELLGGTIWLESEAGKGSTFFFTIPK